MKALPSPALALPQSPQWRRKKTPRHRKPAATALLLAAVPRRHDSSMPPFCWARDTAQPAISKFSCQGATVLRFPIPPAWGRNQQACFAPSSTLARGKRDGSNNVSLTNSPNLVLFGVGLPRFLAHEGARQPVLSSPPRVSPRMGEGCLG